MERNEMRQSGLSREKWLALAIEALSTKSKSKFSLDSLNTNAVQNVIDNLTLPHSKLMRLTNRPCVNSHEIT